MPVWRMSWKSTVSGTSTLSSITVNDKHLKRKGIYVFCKAGTYWSLTLEQVQEMNELTERLLDEAEEAEEHK